MASAARARRLVGVGFPDRDTLSPCRLFDWLGTVESRNPFKYHDTMNNIKLWLARDKIIVE